MNYARSLVTAVAATLLLILLSACGTSDATLREQGRSESYIMGFHDGRHSGMKEAGNYLESIVKDIQRFDSDTDYKEGWHAGEAEGKRMQEQANAASNTYQSDKIADEARTDPDAIAKDAMKGVNTKDLKVLEK